MTPLLRKTLSFSLKGHRSYVQGPDMVDGILAAARAYFGRYPDALSGAFHRILAENGILEMVEPGGRPGGENVHARFSVKMGAQTYPAAIWGAGTKIDSVRVYDETQLIRGARLEGGTVELQFKAGFTYMEQIVALTKLLHRQVFPEERGPWLFTRIRLNRTDPTRFAGGCISIRVEKNLGTRLTQSAVGVDGDRAGTVWFSIGTEREIPC